MVSKAAAGSTFGVALSGFHGFHQEAAGEPTEEEVPGRKRPLVLAVGEVQHPPHFGADEGDNHEAFGKIGKPSYPEGDPLIQFEIHHQQGPALGNDVTHEAVAGGDSGRHTGLGFRTPGRQSGKNVDCIIIKKNRGAGGAEEALGAVQEALTEVIEGGGAVPGFPQGTEDGCFLGA